MSWSISLRSSSQSSHIAYTSGASKLQRRGSDVDTVGRAIVETMEAAGIAVTIAEGDGNVTVTASTPDGQAHLVTGDDLCRELCVAATEAGIDLADV